MTICKTLLTAAFSCFAASAFQSAAITTFDVPGAGTQANQGTFAATINNGGALVGILLTPTS